MHDPHTHHTALKCIIRYIQCTIDFGLHLYIPLPPIISFLILMLIGGGCPRTRRSTLGHCVYLGDNHISWSTKHPTLSHSSARTEYRSVANIVSKSCWLQNLLLELHCPIQKATLVYCDNISVIYLYDNLV